MPGLTVDTQILLFGSGKSDPAREEPCRELMEEIKIQRGAALVVDRECRILMEYKSKLGREPSYAKKWLTTLYKRKNKKLEIVETRPIPRSARVELDEAHFDSSDRKFVSAAYLSTSQRLVSEEKGYTEEIQDILRRQLEVRVLTSESAIAFLAA